MVLNPKPLHAYYLASNDEHSFQDDTGEGGYGKFKSVVTNNYIKLDPLSLLGTNTVPADCNLLILIGPITAYAPSECDHVKDYLREGGRLLALANSLALPKETGLEEILAAYGIDLHNAYVSDPQNSSSTRETDIHTDFITPYHPIGAPLQGSRLRFWTPRPFFQIPNLPADAPRVQTLVTSRESARAGKLGQARFPLAVAVEKGAVKNVITERGSTRIVAIGDSRMFANNFIGDDVNKDFLNLAINWLIERTQLMAGISPKPLDSYRLAFTAGQLRSATWLMLAGIPGVVLMLGGLVWLRRRK
jgi:ABC-2 type transport system permease protein